MMQKNRGKATIRIGVVGENSINDSKALIGLLRKVALENIDFQPIVTKIEGSQLDTPKFFKLLQAAVQDLELNKIIFIRDADEVMNEKIADFKHDKDEWFQKSNKLIGKKGVFFLVIAELEALILADIKGFNEFYGAKAVFTGDPMMQKTPKEKLKNFSNDPKKVKYAETDASDIFEKLDFKTVYKRHVGKRSFQSFADELKKAKIIDFK